MNGRRKLLLHDKVEVRQLEDGLRGAWHSGVVVGVSESCREVKYDELLCESGSSKLIESIPVTGEIEGLYQRPCVKSNYRGRIRPIPPDSEPCSSNSRLKFGVCVDVLFKEAWWEGVVSNCEEGSTECSVYFPDEGDERIFKLTDVRITLEWDEFSGNWRERGVWMLVNLVREHKKDGQLFQLIRRVWSRLRVHYGFQKMISEWTCGALCVWKEYFREVMREITAKPRDECLVFASSSHRHAVKRRGRRSKKLNGSVLTRSMRKRKEQGVKTRRMCLSEPETSPISAATKDRHSTDQFAATNAWKMDETSKTSEGPKYDQALTGCCVNISGSVLVKGGFHHGRTAQSCARDSCFLDSNLKMPLKKRSKRKWQLTENRSTPRKLKPSKTASHLLERHACSEPKMARLRSDNVPLHVLDYNSVDRKEVVKTQKKGMRYHVIRRGGRRRISRRSVLKKRSPFRIKKLPSRKTRTDNILELPLSKQPEAPQPSQKEDDGLRSYCDGSVLGATAPEDSLDSPQKQTGRRSRSHDSVCFICQYGDELLHCDHCMASYHKTCTELEEVEAGESFCPSCRCGLCGSTDCASNDQLFTEVCYQCSRQYHVTCLDKAGLLATEETLLEKFCSRSCFEICARLHQLLQISNPTSVEGLTWTVTRSRRNDCNVSNERVHPLIQVSQVLNVFHECFEPIKEPHTGRDLVADIVYNSGSKFRRLDFHGFYVMALVNGEEPVCVATIRIHGQKVAEMPLIATPFKYRRKGMCRLLLDELEKMLVEMGVERLVLPGIAQLSETWVSSFGFSEMPATVRKEFLAYPFVVFQGTTMFQKILSRSVAGDAGPPTPGTTESTERTTVFSSNSGAQQVDMTGTVPRPTSPITKTYYRKKNWNKELANLKTTINYNYEDFTQVSTEQDRSQPKLPQENCSHSDGGRFSLCYKRKRRSAASNKQKAKVARLDKNQPPYKYVYKRRRIQASRIL